jgi:peptidoglycan/xylan/chitin deacetylase (PgdA/CDA1 family)
LAAVAGGLVLGATGCGSDTEVPSGGATAHWPASAGSPTPPASLTLGPLPAEVGTGPRDRAAVALTFHGQGDPNLVRQLLTELDSGGARATVLAVGTWLSAEPAMARLILDSGHELGNHTQNHRAIAQLPAAQAFVEINTCAQTLKQLTGSIGTWFRPSQTQHATATIQTQAAAVGYPTCLSYDVDSLDYTDPGPDAVVRNTLDAIGHGSIVSLHCGHAGTVSAMPALLDGLRRRGLSAVTMTELMSR